MAIKPNRGNNLFSIDFEMIERTLAEANVELISRIDDLEQAGEKQSATIDSNKTAIEIRDYIRRLRLLIKEVGKTRLSDGRTFSEAGKIISKWFKQYEDRLKVLDKRFAESLATYASDLAVNPDEVKVSGQEGEIGSVISSVTKTKIGETLSGQTVVSVNDRDSPQDYFAPEEIKVPNISTVWEMKGFDRRMIDLEQLRSYLSENALRMAINKHLRETGDRSLNGVVYQQVLSKEL